MVTDLARRLREEEDEHASEQQLANALGHLEVHAPRFVAVEQEAKKGNFCVGFALFELPFLMRDLVGLDVRAILRRYFAAVCVEQDEIEQRNPCAEMRVSQM